MLPKKEQTVSTFIYLSELNPEHLTTDEEIYKMSVDKQEIINKFLYSLKKSAIDCSLNFNECISCDVNEKRLFREDFEIDIKFPNPCNEDTTTITSTDQLKHIKDDIYLDEKNKKKYKLINGKLIEI